LSKQPCPGDEVGAVTLGIQVAENIGPGVIAADCGTQSAIAVAEAAHSPDFDIAGLTQSLCGRVRQRQALARRIIRISRRPTGDANQHCGAFGARICGHPRCSSRRGTPPGTRTNRWQVSWLAGRCTVPPSRAVSVDGAQWLLAGLAAYSCG